MRLSAHRIRSINRAIAKVNGIICGASDRNTARFSGSFKPMSSPNMAGVVKIVAVAKPANSQ
jgi:hypothetical protein